MTNQVLGQQHCEEYILKFYYVESLDDYWIGKRLDTMYYAEWNFELQAFVWTHSKYLPWGEHVVAPDTLWKEYTYPSEPKEIPFTKWIRGFLNKQLSPVTSQRPKGKWIESIIKGLYVKCPLCQRVFAGGAEIYNFCPNCGAEMVGGLSYES